MGKVLIIEDDTLLSNMYAQKFLKEGYEVATAPNGQDGLAKIKEYKPDCVLLDVMMPVMNGIEVLEKIKADPEIQGTPVIMLTNLARGLEDVNRGLELGAVAYMVKSKVKPIEVVAKVKEVIQASGKDIKLTLKNN